MTKKDYELVASAISISRIGARRTFEEKLVADIGDRVADMVVTHLSVRFKVADPRFDEEKFKAACK